MSCYLPERMDTEIIDYFRLPYPPHLSNADLSRTQRYHGLIGLGSRSIDREWSWIGSNTVDTSEGGTVINRVLAVFPLVRSFSCALYGDVSSSLSGCLVN